MTDAEYFSAPGLSHSDMKHLAVSPLRFWHRRLSPDRPADEPTAEMRIGSALHCAILQPQEFDSRYACELIPPEGCLDTMDDLRSFLRDKGIAPKGTRKDDVIAQVQYAAPDAPILSVLTERHTKLHEGKTIFRADEWHRIAAMAQALRDEPAVNELLSEGAAEVPIFVKDPETGVALKGKIDWWRDDCTVDIKTFTHRGGKTIDESIAVEILYRQYYRQMYFYAKLRGWPEWTGRNLLVFVESDQPHEVRIRSLSPMSGAQVNLYWQRAAVEVRTLIRTYAECMEHFGAERPWRYAQGITALEDREMPGLGW